MYKNILVYHKTYSAVCDSKETRQHFQAVQMFLTNGTMQDSGLPLKDENQRVCVIRTKIGTERSPTPRNMGKGGKAMKTASANKFNTKLLTPEMPLILHLQKRKKARTTAILQKQIMRVWLKW